MSQRHSEYEPMPGDLYITPYWPISALCSAESFPQPIWEPACANGDMANSIWNCVQFGSCEVVESDISRGDSFFDFDVMLDGSKSIITNPPYSNGLADRFLYHALDLTEPVKGKVAMLLPLAFDSAQGRRDLFKDHPAFKAKYTLTKRIRWANLEQKKNGPSQNHAWFVWDWGEWATANKGCVHYCGYLP